MSRLTLILFPLVFAACSPEQNAEIATGVQTAEAVDPGISPAVAKACALTTAATSAAVSIAPTSAKAAAAKATSDASCGKPKAQAALTANDAAAKLTGVTVSNSGDSANWLMTTVLPDALDAAKLAIAVAPLL